MIFEGYPGGAQAETIRSGGGERTVGGPSTTDYILQTASLRLQDTGYRMKGY